MIIREYFGAANSYGGFYSKFNDIFRRDKFADLYIIKGGPGTGKSTLMKKVYEYCKSGNINAERIYCSSDPKSLDGLIIHTPCGRIGIVDGTAPHTMEPQFPGAVDHILDLGKGFITERLSSKRRVIEELTRNKSKAYRSAYSLLKSAGAIHDHAIAELSTNGCYFAADRFARDMNLIPTDSDLDCDDIFIHSFSRYGMTVLDGINIHPAIPSDGIVEEIIFKLLSDHIRMQGVNIRLCHSPLSINGICGIGIGATILSTQNSDPTELYPHPYLSTDEYRDLRESHKKLLNHATDSLAKASLAHFSLEDIYTDATSFSIHDEIYGSITEQIDAMNKK